VLHRAPRDDPDAEPASKATPHATFDVTTADTLDPRLRVNATIARYFFGTVAGASLVGVAFHLATIARGGGWALALTAGFALTALVSLVAMRLRDRFVAPALTLVAVLVMALVGLGTAMQQWGLSSVTLGIFGLIVAALLAVTTVRAGLVVAMWGALVLGALALAEQRGWVTGPPAADKALQWRLLLHLLVLGSGTAVGLLLARVVGLYVQASRAREQRFVGLLGIAADAYWELDARLNVVHVSHRQSDGSFSPDPKALDTPPWELPCLQFDEETLDTLRADLEAREPFRDRPARWRDGTALRHLSLSGEPRFDDRGVFLGYWGVARDVSAEVQARAALEITQTRYRELFNRLPTALVLHRRGRVLDANPATLELFGYPDLGSMLGHHLEAHCEPGAARDALRTRIAEVEALPVGQGLEPDELRIHTLDGQHLVVQLSAVRVEAQDGPATLAIVVDETDRRATEGAVRRSEALLSHLVATSPDLITLTELASGRYVMVNETFEQLLGYAREEVVGRRSLEIGVWARPEDREHLRRALEVDGVQRNWPCEFVAKSGRRVQMLVSAARFTMDGRDYVVLNARDITAVERARLEREAILDNASIGIALTRDQVFQLVNPAFEDMLGWPRGTLVGQPGRAVWPSDEDYARIGREIGPALARGERVEIEAEVARHDGSRILCRLLARAVDPQHPIKGGTVWITEDVTEQRRLLQVLAKARDDAEAANRAKSAFLANTSHEIRNPLNQLLNLARIARAPEVDDAQRRQYLELIGDSAEALASVISDILDLSKIEAGKLHVEHVPFDLTALLGTLRRGYGALAEARGMDLALEIAPELPQRVIGDPVRLRQILSNYLSNALKFTGRGSVRVRGRLLEHLGALAHVRFEVEDTGPGIDAAVQARLFEPFTQGDQSTTRRYGGTGLGLSICRDLAQLMGGEVGVESRLGQGSRFWVDLPLDVASDDTPTTGFGTIDGAPLAGARVLVVDDDATNQIITQAILKSWDVAVGEARSGRQAIDAIEQAAAAGRPFDAVLMDLQMPEMDGREATRRLRRVYDARSLPIIALTAAALVAEREDALAAGMNDFVLKPIDDVQRRRLQSALRRLLQR
jgi:PAS domain S-box-containing protein